MLWKSVNTEICSRSFICQGTSHRRQRSDLFSLRINLSQCHLFCYQSNDSKVEISLLSALPLHNVIHFGPSNCHLSFRLFSWWVGDYSAGKYKHVHCAKYVFYDSVQNMLLWSSANGEWNRHFKTLVHAIFGVTLIKLLPDTKTVSDKKSPCLLFSINLHSTEK